MGSVRVRIKIILGFSLDIKILNCDAIKPRLLTNAFVVNIKEILKDKSVHLESCFVIKQNIISLFSLTFTSIHNYFKSH